MVKKVGMMQMLLMTKRGNVNIKVDHVEKKSKHGDKVIVNTFERR
jgi:hypothetical protein